MPKVTQSVPLEPALSPGLSDRVVQLSSGGGELEVQGCHPREGRIPSENPVLPELLGSQS